MRGPVAARRVRSSLPSESEGMREGFRVRMFQCNPRFLLELKGNGFPGVGRVRISAAEAAMAAEGRPPEARSEGRCLTGRRLWRRDPLPPSITWRREG